MANMGKTKMSEEKTTQKYCKDCKKRIDHKCIILKKYVPRKMKACSDAKIKPSKEETSTEEIVL